MNGPPRPGEWYPTPPPPPKPDKKDKDDDEKRRKRDRDAERQVDKHGHDWGLRDVTKNAVAITRAIHVDCYADRLVLAPDSRTQSELVVPLENDSRRSVNRLVSGIWEHMDAWGIAGFGMYWRPVLEFYVVPGGERRFAEFNRLLEGSGFVVQRKQ